MTRVCLSLGIVRLSRGRSVCACKCLHDLNQIDGRILPLKFHGFFVWRLFNAMKKMGKIGIVGVLKFRHCLCADDEFAQPRCGFR